MTERQRRYRLLHETIDSAMRGEFVSARKVGASIASLTNLAAEQLNTGDEHSVIGSALRNLFTIASVYSDTLSNTAGHPARDSDDPEEILEQAYEEALQGVILLRQATAQSIATEKQLEHTLERKKEFIKTWSQRAEIARSQNNEELAMQAENRRIQYVNSGKDLEAQIKRQKIAVLILRQKLNLVETDLEKMSVKKSILLARYKALKATKRAHKVFSKAQGDNSPWQKAKQKILDAEETLANEIAQEEEEQEVDNPSALPNESLPNIATAINSLVLTVERLNSALDRIEGNESKLKD